MEQCPTHEKDEDETKALKGLIKNNQDPSDTLGKIFDDRLDQMDDIVHRHAKQVFVSTALSQHGRLDAFLVLAINFRMLKELISHYGYRPTYPQLVKTYTKVLSAALIADGIEDTQFAEVFPMLSKSFLGGNSRTQYAILFVVAGYGQRLPDAARRIYHQELLRPSQPGSVTTRTAGKGQPYGHQEAVVGHSGVTVDFPSRSPAEGQASIEFYLIPAICILRGT